MHITLKMIEKLDNLLEEAEEYIECATAHSDDSELKRTYVDLATCHYEGYEKLSKYCERAIERKAHNGTEGQVIKQMADWHRNKFDEKAAKVKRRLEQLR